MKLKEREMIIKALEFCSNCKCNNEITQTECPLINMPFCKNYLRQQSLEIIRELAEELKCLESDYDRVYEQAEADIHGNMADGGTSCHWCMNKTKADTVKRMWYKIDTNHRVSTTHYVGHAEPTITYEFTNWELDQMVKEILEGK